jgi:hypothetical protein
MYVEELTGVGKGQKHDDVRIAFGQRKVRMASWTISGKGLCCKEPYIF